MLPLNYLGMISSSPQQELHPRPFAYKANALLAELCGQALRAHGRNRTGNLRFTKALHYRCATRAIWSRRWDSHPRSSRWQRDVLLLNYACKGTRVAFQAPRWKTSSASHRCISDRNDRLAGLSAPVPIVEVRGIEPPVPASQTPCLTVRPHLEDQTSAPGQT